MTPLTAADLDAMLAATGVPVTLGNTTVRAQRLQPGEKMLEEGGAGGVVAVDRIYTIRTGTLPGLAPGAQIRDGEASYRVRDVYPIEDGALTRFHCAVSL